MDMEVDSTETTPRESNYWDLSKDPLILSFWRDIQNGCWGPVIIPTYYKNIFRLFGFDNHLSLQSLTEECLEEFTVFVRSPLYAKMIPPGADKSDFYGLYGKTPHLFKFNGGDRNTFRYMLEIVGKRKSGELFLCHRCSTDSSQGTHPLANESDNIQRVMDDLREDLPQSTISLLELMVRTHEKLRNRKPSGNRYDHSLKMFFAFIRLVSGPLAYETIAYNFKNTVPALSTINRFIHQSAEPIVEGQLMIRELRHFLDVRGLPRTIILSEDATRITSMLQYNPKTDQCVGLTLPLDEHSITFRNFQKKTSCP
ncbi:hypothetical protein QAD02_016081 [Eretmocerus hayati]|uniref:Uncharacterized protein n=1 Tax=Eretmocerus hayati TaxID=131215 RepID=A0ACC2PAH0_9HYME|nr:hypothetical protein QAD02_016081 [Eretmocerus hayati]